MEQAARKQPEERDQEKIRGGRRTGEEVRKPFVDPAEAVMNSNPNLSPPIVPNPN